MGVAITHRGNFNNLEKLLKKSKSKNVRSILEKYGAIGVAALTANTPVRTGETAGSWSYTIEKTPTGYSLMWSNDNVVDHVNIAIILDRGHAARDGSWVEGYHFIDPALEPIFNNIAESAWKEVTSK